MGPGELMVEVTVSGGHPAGGEDTFGVSDFDISFLSGAGSSFGADHSEQLVLIVDADPPLGFL